MVKICSYVVDLGDYPPLDADFSRSPLKKSAVTPIEERGQKPFGLSAAERIYRVVKQKKGGTRSASSECCDYILIGRAVDLINSKAQKSRSDILFGFIF